MDYPSTNISLPVIDKILRLNQQSFAAMAFEIFNFQYRNNPVYRKWVDALHINPAIDGAITQIPFLPISFFKTHQLTVSDALPEIIFTSSGTTGVQTSSHYVQTVEVYRRSFMAAFRLFYGDPEEWAIIGLLPSYLERQGSSLVVMADELIKASNNTDSGFFLYNFEQLKETLQRREKAGKKTWLIGVTYALIDFAEQYPMPLQHTVVLETGGMKGRKKELTRMEVQAVLKEAFALPSIHSEYGMTELLSQAYSSGDGNFKCPPWMKMLVRDEDDPLLVKTAGVGALCIIDLANFNSCSFIATEDLGRLHADGSFEIMGRMDNSDVRGCSLLSL